MWNTLPLLAPIETPSEGGRSCPPGFSWIVQRSVRLSVGNHRKLREIRKNNLEHPPCCHRGNLVRKVFQEKTLRLGRCFRDMPRSSHWRAPTRFRPRQSELSCAASRIVSLLGLAVALTCLLG